MTTWMEPTAGRGIDRAGRGIRMALLLIGWCMAGAACRADEPAPLAPDAPVAAVLDALKARGDSLKDFTADVSLNSLDTGTQVTTIQGGQMIYQNDPATGGRLRVNFNTTKVESLTTIDKHQYILDGQNLQEIDFKKKRVTTQQVLKAGQKMNLLKLGEGPFPLPIGQDPAEVRNDFDVTRPAAAKDDPAGTVHIALTPKAGTPLARKFTTIDVFVDCKTDMPVRVATLDQSGAEFKTTDLKNLKINQGLPADAFQLPAEAKDFDTQTRPYQQ